MISVWKLRVYLVDHVCRSNTNLVRHCTGPLKDLKALQTVVAAWLRITGVKAFCSLLTEWWNVKWHEVLIAENPVWLYWLSGSIADLIPRWRDSCIVHMVLKKHEPAWNKNLKDTNSNNAVAYMSEITWFGLAGGIAAAFLDFHLFLYAPICHLALRTGLWSVTIDRWAFCWPSEQGQVSP